MKMLRNIVSLSLLITVIGCSGGDSLFTGYRKETFSVTRVSENRSKTIQILNESETDIQHVLNIAFYANSNKAGNFQVTKAMMGTEKVSLNDIYIPPMGVLNLTITYAPLDLNTTVASFAGWTTLSSDKAIVSEEENGETSAVEYMAEMVGSGTQVSSDKPKEMKAAIHRAMLVVAYDKPKGGYEDIELVGGALPGPNGEVTAVGMGGAQGGDCAAGAGKACFRGTFSIDLPGLTSTGPMEVPLHGPIPLKIEGTTAELNMDEFPPILIALKGNGPGEPLEGKPVDAISIIVSGKPETTCTGSFDGRNLSLSAVNFRIRVQLGEVKYEDINPGFAAAVDFIIPDLEITTAEAFDGSKIVFGTETTLSSTPSNNTLFDSFLGGARIIAKFTGMLELP